MYNRYLSTACDGGEDACEQNPLHNSEPSCGAQEPSRAAPQGKPEGGGLLSGLSSAVTARLQNLHFDLDTLIILVAIYFLIADSDDFDTELLVLIGVMFVLGF